MKMIKTTIVLIALALSAPLLAETDDNNTSDTPDTPVSAPASAPTPPPAPATVEEIATGVCAGCHSADGNSVIPMNPILAGQHAEYITKQLMDFKATDNETPKRNSPVMSSMVAALTPDEMKKLGEYYAKQKTTPSQAPTDEKLLELGKILYHGGNIEDGVPACASCHGPKGSGIPPRYPALAGQHAEYTMTQLNSFNMGDRKNDNSVMQQVLSRMSGQEKKAVSAYIATMH
ncbi:cytochrome c4 [Nitrosomonas sp. JL21]|uniref:c-type cytochrome n=1 Tax=Nitrosomonas sp. JL21 TaxID=153949 RepID=UPI00136B8261|nr:c-type cytochrome [Nitrosomonas sp. JL21]MBL8498802.1 cytochrome c4 [Nitrosomonas sp.]MCC7091060.1 cytochrome c4 [Nitrosomonas sp.]MXS78029.1 cytochrome c4 [Nitrosomonas sp. JL21]